MWTKNFDCILCDAFGAGGKWLTGDTAQNPAIGNIPLTVKNLLGQNVRLEHGGSAYNGILINNDFDNCNLCAATLDFPTFAYNNSLSRQSTGNRTAGFTLYAQCGYTDNADVPYDKYVLDNVFDTNNFTFQTTQTSEFDEDTLTYTKHLHFALTYAGNGQITVNEFGLLCYVYGTQYYEPVLIYYDHLQEPATLNAGDIINFHVYQSYKIQSDYPEVTP